MELNSIPLFAMLSKRMAWLHERQRVLAQNIANSDTPNYKPKDLKELDFKRLVASENRRIAVSSTRAGHMSGVPRPTHFRDSQQRETFEVAPDGNAVVVEEQLMKVAETNAAFQLTTNLYKKHLAMIRLVIGRGS